jgi:uncharacterized protein YhfF
MRDLDPSLRARRHQARLDTDFSGRPQFANLLLIQVSGGDKAATGSARSAVDPDDTSSPSPTRWILASRVTAPR